MNYRLALAGVVAVGCLFTLAGSARMLAPAASDDPPAGPAPLDQAAQQIELPDGFHATVFAGEPDVKQPIAFTFDDRGRLWVVENYSYPNWMPGAVRGQDRIVILDDENGDGKFDRRTVFWDRGDNLTGIELGFGGVWLCATPNLIFISDQDGDDVPDSPPQIVLDGWDPNCRHNAFTALRWGPDGWLYGCNGILSNSKIGRPGTPDNERTPINCGVWRYHPVHQQFEVVANGTTNPWGLDFDDAGELFITNCVIPHLFHVVPGAHFQRMYGQDFNPHLYELMPSCADHIHWGGGDWTSSRGGEGIHSVAGGGHAHAGAMVYLGDNWPDRYRNSIFMLNIHGRRVNHDRLTRSGAGYVAKHEPDLLVSRDPWFRGLELKAGPDGAVFMSDWSDIGECHDYDAADGVHRENGRLFKISYGKPKVVRPNMKALTDADLVEHQLAKNDWFVRHARRLLHERAAAGRNMHAVHASLRSIFENHPDVSRKLRALWALHVTGGLDQQSISQSLCHDNENVRAWSVRFAFERQQPAAGTGAREMTAKVAEMAANDPSPLVRIHIAGALTRLPAEQRWLIAEQLAQGGDRDADRNLMRMIWYAIEPLVPLDRARAAEWAGRAPMPSVRQFVARRITADFAAIPAGDPKQLAELMQQIRQADMPVQQDLLRGIHEAIKGHKGLRPPPAWLELLPQVAEHPELREQALAIGLVFGDPQAAQALRRIMLNRAEPAERRQSAIQALVEAAALENARELLRLLDDPAVRSATIRALAAFEDPSVPDLLLERYGALSESERFDAVSTLAARPGHARLLVQAIGSGKVPSRDVSPYVARQLFAFGDAKLNKELERVWGSVRATNSDRKKGIEKYKALITTAEHGSANAARGRNLFQRTCAQCHRLFGEGSDVGPDLTGSNRDNLDFILENVVDPNAIVGRDFKLTVVATKDGRILSGIVRERSAKTIVLQTENDRLTIAADDIDELKESSNSMMPEGILDSLSADEVRDLIAYLSAKSR